MKKVAIFPGSFDPFTNGHKNIVLRSLNLFDEIIIGIGENTSKTRYFNLEDLIPKIKGIFHEYPQVKVESYQGLTAHFAREKGARFLIRGLRNTTDFEYENSVSQANQYLWDELETVFLITSPKYASISSSLVREIHKHGGPVEKFLPYEVD